MFTGCKTMSENDASGGISHHHISHCLNDETYPSIDSMSTDGIAGLLTQNASLNDISSTQIQRDVTPAISHPHTDIQITGIVKEAVAVPAPVTTKMHITELHIYRRRSNTLNVLLSENDSSSAKRRITDDYCINRCATTYQVRNLGILNYAIEYKFALTRHRRIGIVATTPLIVIKHDAECRVPLF